MDQVPVEQRIYGGPSANLICGKQTTTAENNIYIYIFLMLFLTYLSIDKYSKALETSALVREALRACET